MRILIGIAVAGALAHATPAQADIVGAAVQAFGLVGTWSNDCSRNLDKHQAGFRMSFEVPDHGPPIRTIVSSDGAKTTTVKSEVLSAIPNGAEFLAIGVRLSGAGSGEKIPAYLNTPQQSFQKTEPNVLFVRGRDGMRLQRCTE
ncbi:MAG TPA: hypothetical protein VHW66_12915 [Stellaceae bacterium]|jgi:hypothetical protein|nr:hypothetical protein [Stellaceae bacterium]